MKNLRVWLAALAAMFICMPSSHAGSFDSGYTLFVVPARFSVVQLMFDVIDKRPAVLVSCQEQPDTGEPVLHAWNGTSWVPIRMHDFRELNFLQKTPGRIVLIGDSDAIPEAVRESLSWRDGLTEIADLTNARILNELNPMFRWRAAEWKWFAARYRLQLEDEASAYRISSWYDQPGPLRRTSGVAEPALPESESVLPEAEPVPSPEVEPAPIEDEAAGLSQPPELEPVVIEEYPEAEVVEVLIPAEKEAAPAVTRVTMPGSKEGTFFSDADSEDRPETAQSAGDPIDQLVDEVISIGESDQAPIK